jgi:hypothetical protein
MRLAQSEKPIAPHIDHAAVAEILRNTKLEEMVANMRECGNREGKIHG